MALWRIFNVFTAFIENMEDVNGFTTFKGYMKEFLTVLRLLLRIWWILTVLRLLLRIWKILTVERLLMEILRIYNGFKAFNVNMKDFIRFNVF
jgi:hypothetical protein